MEKKKFTHLNESNDPSMVDVSAKSITSRTAIAQSIIKVNDEVRAQFKDNDIRTKKGPVFQTAIVAGIMAVKQTSNLIPLCHPLLINKCDVRIELGQSGDIVVQCEVKIDGKTGVEMEALTGASIAALTIYDMCKSFSHDIVIVETKLLKKTGGKSDYLV